MPAPLLGADTDAVLRDLLGCSESEIARLRESQVVC
jgi:crotonobetainyl-CoA:carnitine CoA-transferase CaiB-like acyl-CoA transferase